MKHIPSEEEIEKFLKHLENTFTRYNRLPDNLCSYCWAHKTHCRCSINWEVWSRDKIANALYKRMGLTGLFYKNEI